MHIAVDLAAENKHDDQQDIWEKVTVDEYMKFAIQESFQTIEQLLLSMFANNINAQRW